MSVGLDDWLESDHPEKRKSKPDRHSHKIGRSATSDDIDDWLESEQYPEIKAQVFAGQAISPELLRWFIGSPQLEESYLDAIASIKSRFDDLELNAYVDRDYEDPSEERPVLEVRADIDDVEEWINLKTAVRDLVRDAEYADVMIYTRIERI